MKMRRSARKPCKNSLRYLSLMWVPLHGVILLATGPTYHGLKLLGYKLNLLYFLPKRKKSLPHIKKNLAKFFAHRNAVALLRPRTRPLYIYRYLRLIDELFEINFEGAIFDSYFKRIFRKQHCRIVTNASIDYLTLFPMPMHLTK